MRFVAYSSSVSVRLVPQASRKSGSPEYFCPSGKPVSSYTGLGPRSGQCPLCDYQRDQSFASYSYFDHTLFFCPVFVDSHVPFTGFALLHLAMKLFGNLGYVASGLAVLSGLGECFPSVEHLGDLLHKDLDHMKLHHSLLHVRNEKRVLLDALTTPVDGKSPSPTKDHISPRFPVGVKTHIIFADAINLQYTDTIVLLVTGEHSFQPPDFDKGDQRGPCPGLNALANHGYISRDGIAGVNMSWESKPRRRLVRLLIRLFSVF